MKFFVPAARDPAMAEQAWEATRRFLADQGCPTTERRIRRLAFRHDMEDFDLVVGGIHPGLEYESFLEAGGEDQVWRYLVFVILEDIGRPCYYVCTGARGVLRAIRGWSDSTPPLWWRTSRRGTVTRGEPWRADPQRRPTAE